MTDVLCRKTTTCSFLMVLAASAWVVLTSSVCAQEVDEAKATKVKAAYLYNFTKFIQWPDTAFEDDKAPFVIGVLGDDPFGRILDDTVRGKKIAERSVKIRRLSWKEEEGRTSLRSCHILYISDSERYRLDDILAALEQRPVLVVSDVREFASDGGMIGFVLEQGRIIFEVNREALERAELKASSKLLKLARIVEPSGRPARESRVGTRRP